MSDTTLLFARFGLAALYLQSAINKLGGLGGIADALAAQGFPFAMAFATFAAVGELAGALGVIAGFKTRVAALGLVAYTVIVSLVFHGFWTLEGAARGGEYLQFMKNLGLASGFLLLAVAGPGRFSLDAWLHQHAKPAKAVGDG